MKNDCSKPFCLILTFQLIILLLFSNPAVSQQPYFKQISTIEDFGAGQIKCIYQDRLGFVWIGATSGAYRFDGQDFVGLKVSDSILNKSVTAIFEDLNNTLWFGFEDGNILKSDRFQTMVFKPQSELPVNKITSITESENRSLWFGTYGDGIFVYQNDSLIRFNSESGLSDNYIYTIIADDKGNIWAGTDNGINICSLSKNMPVIRVLSVAEGLPDFIVRTLKKDNRGNIWIGMHNNGLTCFRPEENKFEILANPGNWKMGSINDIVFSNSSLWIATDGNGLVEYTPSTGEISQIHQSEDLNLSRINSMLADSEGNIWLVSNKELNFSLSNRLSFLKEVDNIGIRNIHAIMVDKHDILWFANDKGLYSYNIYNSPEQIRFKQYPLKFQSEESKIMSLYRDPFGFVWIGTFGQGLIRFDPKSGRQISIAEKNGLLNGNVLSIEGSEDEIWFATLGGAFKCKIDNRLASLSFVPEFINYGQDEGLSNSFIYNLHIDNTGHIWFATDGSGLYCYKEGRFVNIPEDSSFRDKVIYSVTTDSTGNVWMNVSKEGLYKYDGNKVIKVFTDEEHKNLSFSGIITNNNNELIIAYKGGIDVMNINSGEVAHYEGNAGLSQINPDPNAITIDSKGIVWIGSDKGIIRYQSPDNQTWKHPQPRITNVQVYLENTNHVMNNVFGHNQNHLSFSYSGLWFQYPEKVEYQIKLDGHDMDWIDTKNKNVIYSNLSPGDYTFNVKASLYNNFITVTADSYSFTINRPFWKKSWFFVLILILLIAGVYLYIRFREKRLKRRQEAMREKIRFQFENLKSQINPHFLFNSFSTLIALIDQNQNTAIEYVEELSNLFRTLLEYKDQELIMLNEELSIVNNYYNLQKKRYGSNLQLQISKEKLQENIMLPPLTLQLLIENAVKHNVVSKEHVLKIEIYTDQPSEYLFVENNRHKKNEPVSSTGIGIRNIIDRYNLLTDKKIQIIQSEEFFKVGLPFIYKTHENTNHRG
jgi:ligand-binding sensor domain-containing protein